MTNLLLGWIAEPAMSALLGQLFEPVIRLSPTVLSAVAVGLGFLIVTLLTVVLSELIPKALTLRYAPASAILTALPILWIRSCVRPLVWIMNGMANLITRPLGLGRVEDVEEQRITVDELQMMVTQAAEQGVLSPRSRTLALNALALGRRKARQIMVPRVQVDYMDLRWSMRKNYDVVQERLFTRLPLCDGGLDHVVGIINVKQFLTAYKAEGETSVLRLLAAPPVFAPETATPDRLLALLGEKQTEMLFLVDEFGGVEGVVTLRDVVAELIGEVRNEN
jgi:CBS domain containing-hemolysin-like protein